MYVSPNFKTKKALKEAIAEGKPVSIFSPGPFPAQHSGTIAVEGPWYPQLHSWYARVKVEDGKVIKILS